jgi:citrate lyase subunit gamma (acyl carrier protein)
MNEIQHPAQAGTIESSDIMIQLSPAEKGSGITITLESPVKKQFGTRISSLISEALSSAGILDAKVHALDRGALDYTIQARMEAVIIRAMQSADKENPYE